MSSKLRPPPRRLYPILARELPDTLAPMPADRRCRARRTRTAPCWRRCTRHCLRASGRSRTGWTSGAAARAAATALSRSTCSTRGGSGGASRSCPRESPSGPPPSSRGRARRRTRFAPAFPGSSARCSDDDDDAVEAFCARFAAEPCPVLDGATGRCELYASRPIACRTFGPPVRIGAQDLPPCDWCFSGTPEDAARATAVVDRRGPRGRAAHAHRGRGRPRRHRDRAGAGARVTDRARDAWARTTVHVWPGAYLFASVPAERMADAAALAAAAPAGTFVALVRERDEVALTLPEALARAPRGARAARSPVPSAC